MIVNEITWRMDDKLNVFWMGASGKEFIAWKGSHQIFIYDCEQYPNPPCELIQHIG